MNRPPRAFLSLPDSGERTMANVMRKVHTLAAKAYLSLPLQGVSAEVQGGVREVRQLLTDAIRRKPAASLAAISQPEILTDLLILHQGTSLVGLSFEEVLRRASANLIAALSRHSSRAVTWIAPVSELWVGDRFLQFDPPCRAIRAAGKLVIELHDGTAFTGKHPSVTMERPLHAIHPDLPGLRLAMRDANPLSIYEAHPDKYGNALTLGKKSMDEWLASLRGALDLIRDALPAWFDELKVTQHRFVPVGYLPERHESASYREAPGVAYLTLCDDPVTLAEAIVHETQHTKINALSWLDPIVHNGLTAWTESPVRPDLRPLWGVLLAAHAFVPVAALHRNLAQSNHPLSQTERFPRRRKEVLVANRNGMRATQSVADPTTSGKRIIDDLDALLSFLETEVDDLDGDPNLLPPS